MADGAVNFLLDKLTTILLQKVSLLGDCGDEIEEIKLELESMRSFLRDAERRKAMSDSVETWVKQVRETAYEVEDIVDEYIHHKHTSGRILLQNGFKGLLQDLVSFPKNVTSRHHLSSNLQKIKAKVFEVSARGKRYGFDERFDEGMRSRTMVRDGFGESSSSFLDDYEDEIVGMEGRTEQLLGWLAEDEPRRTVISIVGMGGLGKTTLVTRVYKTEMVRREFDCWAWISVSQMYGIGELLLSMIKELFGKAQVLIPSNVGSMNYRQLVGVLIDYLHQKRYVVVLDDVWSIDLWSKIRCAFPNNRYGSRVILTTRNENVATSVGTGSRVYRLEPLQGKDAWALFCRKAFWNDPDRACPKELQPLAESILRKCEGLPLAIVAVGGLMCSRSKTVVAWKNVYESLNWQLSNNPMLEQVKGILLLSFNDLPFYLKHCFLYCVVFRDGHLIKRTSLIRLWIAEGFIKERRGMTLEEVAEEYLTELILRSMIQVTKTNDAGRAKLCRVHDVMRDLAMATAEKEDFCKVYCDGHHHQQSRLEGKIHRLTVHSTGESIRMSSTTLHHLRSLFVFPTDMSSFSFSLDAISSKFRLLRVLNLVAIPIETIPSTLVDLFNLRYLNLRDTKIRELPKSIKKLNNLQTLDVRNTYLERLPNGMAKLSSLRHLCLNHKNFNPSTQLVNIPLGICDIRSLQTLACVEAEKELILRVGNLTDLKKFEIVKLRAAEGPKLCSSIQRMAGLLRLSVMAISEQELQLESLSMPPMFLEKLTLVGKLNSLPPWLGSVTSLTHLKLGFSCIKADIVSPLHTLSCLVFLEFKKAYDGKSLHFKKGWLPRLNKLNLVELSHLENLKLDQGSLPSIREMYLIRCGALNVLPHGIEHLTGLQKLHLEAMPEQLVQKLQSCTSEDQEKIQHIIPIINLV